ncbi:MAG: hypothetical protein OSA99_20800, partial [Acidimicrobiales bacterium]|nr:hypothetical protein [Acidimicrobiales bacterium]
DIDGALDAFDRAIEVFSNSSEEGRRGRAATLVNKGMLLSSTGTAEALARAVETFASATEAVAGDEAPYHSAMADHARGVAEMDLAAVDHNERDTHLRRAVRAFEESLAFFTRTGFPYQHSLAKHNLGRALLGLGGEGSALSALVAVEDAVAVLDPRIHRTEWEHALASLGEIETALAEVHPGVSRRGLFVVLFESSDRDERAALLVNRLTRVLALPPDARHSALRELAAASLRATDDGLAYIGIELTVLTELPNEHLESALRARLAAHGELDGERREAADRALDQAVGDALNGPQRVFVRDFLAANGFERP